jgi:hypothetical protein
MNIDLETFFVFPNANEEMEDAEDEMETDEDNAVCIHYIPFHFSILFLHLSLHFISPFISLFYFSISL